MSPSQWFALLCFYTIYLFFGASIFYNIEHGYEMERRAEELAQRIEINELMVQYTSSGDKEVQDYVLNQVTKYCGKPVTNHTLDKYVDPYVWSFYHSVFFAFTVCSTLGYGNIAPTHTFGQYFMILYALIGIPVNGILYAYLGEFFGETFVGAYNRYKVYKMNTNKNYVPKQLGMIAQITLYLVPAAVLLIFLPSCLFTYFEGWPYSVSVYYSFVTLSTIGFGDYIPTFQPHQEREFGISFKFYQAFVIIWFVFGLSYLLMLIGFIARGMQSKRLARLEQQLTENIKFTHNRIWSGMTKDASYLKRILNEVHMMKLKPVYIEPGQIENEQKINRSESCPELTLYRSPSMPKSKARATSIQYNTRTRHSDTELHKIDKKKTFNEPPEAPALNANTVLAKVVQALGHVNDHTTANNIGMGLFRFGSQIVTCQSMGSGLSTKTTDFGCVTPPIKPRDRAVSEFQPPIIIEDDWGWNRPENNNVTSEPNLQSKTERSASIVIDEDNPQNLSPSLRRSILNKFHLNKKRDSIAVNILPNGFDLDTQSYLDKTLRGRDSKISLSKQNRRMSQLPTIESSHENVLENTTLADIIRAIESVENRDAVVSYISEKPPNPVISRRRSLYPGQASNVQLNNRDRRQSYHPEMIKYMSTYKPPFGLLETPLERRLNVLFPKNQSKGSGLLRRLSVISNKSIKEQQVKEVKSNPTAIMSLRRASHAPLGSYGKNKSWKRAKLEAMNMRHSSLRDLNLLKPNEN